jgi:hypothetical protein
MFDWRHSFECLVILSKNGNTALLLRETARAAKFLSRISPARGDLSAELKYPQTWVEPVKAFS